MGVLDKARVWLAEVFLGLAAHLFWPDTPYQIDYETEHRIVLRRGVRDE